MGLKKIFPARIAIIAAIVAMMVLSYTSYIRTNRLNDLSELVTHSHIVHVTLERTYSRLRDADSELNSFLLTRDSAYHKKLIYAEARIDARVKELQVLTLDNPLQRERIMKLDSLIAARHSFIERGLQSSDLTYTLNQISLCNTAISKLIGVLTAEETQLLLQRESSTKTYKAVTPILLFCFQLIIIAFLFVVYIKVIAEFRLKSKLQKEVEHQINFIQAILDNSVDMIVVFDHHMNLIAANRKAKEMFGITEAMIGKNFYMFFPKGKNSRSHQEFQEAFKGQFRHIKKHKPLLIDRILESFFIPLFKDGKVYAAMAIHHDITDLVNASEELELKNSELRKSNEQLERFAYVASHDLQEPIRKIRTFADLADRKNSPPEKTREYMRKISSSAERMSVLINEVLNYSRLSSPPVDIEAVDLNAILDQVKTDFELLIREKGATIESQRLPIVQGSGLQLFQVFSNLISNALKFNTKLPVIQILCESDDHFYEISVIDNGIGFDSKYENQIFEIFARLQNRADYAGTGIGLAVCKRIITNHKGTIEARSTKGLGTKFTIRLPKPTAINVSIPIENKDGNSIIKLPAEVVTGNIHAELSDTRITDTSQKLPSSNEKSSP